MTYDVIISPIGLEVGKNSVRECLTTCKDSMYIYHTVVCVSNDRLPSELGKVRAAGGQCWQLLLLRSAQGLQRGESFRNKSLVWLAPIDQRRSGMRSSMTGKRGMDWSEKDKKTGRGKGEKQRTWQHEEGCREGEREKARGRED